MTYINVSVRIQSRYTRTTQAMYHLLQRYSTKKRIKRIERKLDRWHNEMFDVTNPIKVEARLRWSTDV